MHSSIIQSKISDGIDVLHSFFCMIWKSLFYHDRGKSTGMGGGQIRAVSADLKNHLSGISDLKYLKIYLDNLKIPSILLSKRCE